MNTKTLLILISFYFTLSIAYTQNKEIFILKHFEDYQQINMSESTINKYLNSFHILKSSDIQKNTDRASFDKSAYISMGLGVGTFNGIFSGTYGMNVGIIIEKNIFILRYNKVNEIQFLGNDKPNKYISDLGLLYGRVKDMGSFKLSASVGIAYNMGVLRGDLISNSNVWFGDRYYTTLSFESFGIPVQADIFLGTNHKFDINFTFFANFNQKYSFGGLQLCLRFGKLKSNYLRVVRE